MPVCSCVHTRIDTSSYTYIYIYIYIDIYTGLILRWIDVCFRIDERLINPTHFKFMTIYKTKKTYKNPINTYEKAIHHIEKYNCVHIYIYIYIYLEIYIYIYIYRYR